MCFEVVCCHFGDGKEKSVVMNILWQCVGIFRRCAVPCFVIMTFYFARKIFILNDKGVFYKRLYRLFLPNLAWAIIYIFVIWICQDYNAISGLRWSKAFVLQVFLGHVYNRTMWFQVDLIWLTCVYYILYKLFGEKKKLLKSILLIILVVSLVFQYSSINYKMFCTLPDYAKFTVGRVIEIIPYSVVGLLWEKDLLKQNTLWNVMRWTVLLILSCIVVKVDNIEGTFGYAGVGLLLMGYCITRQFDALNCVNFPADWRAVIRKISPVTMGCYFMHRLIGTMIMYLNLNIFNDSPFTRCVAVFVVSMVCSYLMSLVQNKTVKAIVM